MLKSPSLHVSVTVCTGMYVTYVLLLLVVDFSVMFYLP